jgi:hypothetical protein
MIFLYFHFIILLKDEIIYLKYLAQQLLELSLLCFYEPLCAISVSLFF